MAAPADLNVLDLTGKYVMNKTLSDQTTDEILKLQGISWVGRKLFSTTTVTLAIEHYKGKDGVERIEAHQIPGPTEMCALLWEERDSSLDPLLGWINGKSRRIKAEELDIPFLKEGWTADTFEHGLIQSYLKSDTPQSGRVWIANQTWGMEDINGERRYVRHVKFTGPKAEDIEAKLVYDYIGPLDN